MELLQSFRTSVRPISNLAFISKLTERIVASQAQWHMTENKLYPLLQSAYHRKNKSTETALLKVKNDLLLNMDKGHVSLLVLLDLVPPLTLSTMIFYCADSEKSLV